MPGAGWVCFSNAALPIVCPSAGTLEGKAQAQGDKLAGMEVRVGMLGQVPDHAINP